MKGAILNLINSIPDWSELCVCCVYLRWPAGIILFYFRQKSHYHTNLRSIAYYTHVIKSVFCSLVRQLTNNRYVP